MAETTPEATPTETLTRGQRAARTRAANKKKAQQAPKKSLPLAYLQDVLSSLDDAGQTLQGYAAIKSATVVLTVPHEGAEYTVSATHNGTDWVLENVKF